MPFMLQSEFNDLVAMWAFPGLDPHLDSQTSAAGPDSLCC